MMETHPLDDFDDLAEDHASGVPEDVAILYSWANLQGAKYRDFSANRREHRAQMRQRAAEQLRLVELKAQSEAETAAKQAEAEAAAAHAEADAAAAKLAAAQAPKPVDLGGHAWKKPEGTRLPQQDQAPHVREQDEQVKQASLRAAAQQARRAAAEREEAARRAEAAALADSIARREQQEIADAQASAVRHAARYAEADARNRAGGNGIDAVMARVPGKLGDPYSSRWLDEEDGLYPESVSLNRAMEVSRRDPINARAEQNSDAGIADDHAVEPHEVEEAAREAVAPIYIRQKVSDVVPQPFSTIAAQDELSRAKGDSRAEVIKSIPESGEKSAHSALEESPKIGLAADSVSLFEVATHAMSELFEAEPVSAVEHIWNDTEAKHQNGAAQLAPAKSNGSDSRAKRAAGSAGWGGDVPGPAWLYPRQHASSMQRPAALSSNDVAEPLEQSKERIAARWFALRGVFARQDADRTNERQLANVKTRQAPIVVVFSVAGGTGKTSLVATLGRALSFLGERVLLSDTTSHGLLPFYFGASQLVSGVVRTFSPPVGSTDAPIHLVSYDAVRESDEAEGQAGIVEDLLENSQRANRVVLDLSASCPRMVGLLGQYKPTILIPLMADMNSVISIHAVEKLFSTMLDADGRPLQPVYLLNQFDASLPLHLDIREVLKQQFGDRVLPFVIRRSAAVGEALAEGMTIVDYDPGSAVAEDYLRVAKWLRSVSAPAALGLRHQRWSEQ